METKAPSFKFFSALASENNFTYLHRRMIKDREYWRIGPKGCFAILGMILLTIYVISFPTLVNSMMGYATLSYTHLIHRSKGSSYLQPQTWFILIGSGSCFLNTKRFDYLDYVILDGSSIRALGINWPVGLMDGHYRLYGVRSRFRIPWYTYWLMV